MVRQKVSIKLEYEAFKKIVTKTRQEKTIHNGDQSGHGKVLAKKLNASLY